MKSGMLLKHLDAPVRFLTFTWSDLIRAVIPIFLGALFDSLVLIPCIGLFALLFAKRTCRRFPRFYAIRYLYWSLPSKQFNSFLRLKLPPSNQRFWIK